MSNRKAVIKAITRALQQVRYSEPGYSAGVNLGKGLGSLNTAVEAQAIDYAEFQRLMELLDNAHLYRGYLAHKSVTHHVA